MLLYKVERFLTETGMPWTRFGRLAAHDPRFVDDLRNGRNPSRRTSGRIERFMAQFRETAHAD